MDNIQLFIINSKPLYLRSDGPRLADAIDLAETARSSPLIHLYFSSRFFTEIYPNTFDYEL